MGSSNTNKQGEEGAAQAAPILPPGIMDIAKSIGVRVARNLFEDRGNHSEAHLSEVDLAVQCAAAAGAAFKMAAESMAEISAVKVRIPQMEDPQFARAVIIHLGRDGTINYVDARAIDVAVVIEGMPVFSVDTVEQAKELQVHFGRLQFRTNPRDPSKPWYLLHRLPGGLTLSSRPQPLLTVEELPEITKMLQVWFAGRFPQVRS